jgi:hypothetical protein
MSCEEVLLNTLRASKPTAEPEQDIFHFKISPHFISSRPSSSSSKQARREFTPARDTNQFRRVSFRHTPVKGILYPEGGDTRTYTRHPSGQAGLQQ